MSGRIITKEVCIDEFLQLSSMQMKKNHTFRPHQHIYKQGEKEVIAQESWVVIKGSVECHFYDTNGILLYFLSAQSKVKLPSENAFFF